MHTLKLWQTYVILWKLLKPAVTQFVKNEIRVTKNKIKKEKEIFGRYSSELAQLVPLTYFQGRSAHYSYRLNDFSVTVCRCYKDDYIGSFFPHTVQLWNSLPIECFPLTYDLNGFKSRINRHLLTSGCF